MNTRLEAVTPHKDSKLNKIYPPDTDHASALILHDAIPPWANHCATVGDEYDKIRSEHDGKTVRIVSNLDGSLHEWNNMIGTVVAHGRRADVWHILLEDTEAYIRETVHRQHLNVIVRDARYGLVAEVESVWHAYPPYMVKFPAVGIEGQADVTQDITQPDFYDARDKILEPMQDSKERSEVKIKAREDAVISNCLGWLGITVQHGTRFLANTLRIAPNKNFKGPKAPQFYHCDIINHPGIRAEDFIIIVANIYPSGKIANPELHFHGHGKATIHYQKAVVMRGDCEHAGMKGGPSRMYANMRHGYYEDGPKTVDLLTYLLLGLSLVTPVLKPPSMSQGVTKALIGDAGVKEKESASTAGEPKQV